MSHSHSHDSDHHHHHGHGHGHGSHGDEQIIITANQTRFDEMAKEEDHPAFVQAASELAPCIRDIHKFDKATTTVLDFACGTGLYLPVLAPYAKSIVGVDVSEGSVARFNKRVSDLGFSPGDFHAVSIKLTEDDALLDGVKFDVVMCNMAIHHFTDIRAYLKILAFFVKPGGSLIVTDIEAGTIVATDREAREKLPDVPHAGGISEVDMKEHFTGVGLTDVIFKPAVAGPWQNGGKTFDFKVFIARGIKI